MWYIYTVEYYSAVKNNDVMKFADKWTELKKKVILTEGTQTLKDKHDMYVLNYKWILDVKQGIITAPEKVGKKADPNRVTH